MKKYLPKSFIIFLFIILNQTIFAQQGWVWKKGTNQTAQQGAYGTLGVANPGNNPGTREGACYWKDANGDFWLFGGEGNDFINNSGHLNDLWKYNVATNQWTWVKGDNLIAQTGVYGTIGLAASTNKPGGRAYASTWLDNNGNVYLFGGFGLATGSGLGFLNDLWKYNPTTNQWTWLHGNTTTYAAANYGTILTPSSTNVPGARYDANSWIDGAGNLWLFGGLGNTTTSTTAGYLNDLWKFDIVTNEWTWMKGSNVINTNGSYGQQTVSTATDNPGGRHSAMSWIDATGNFWLYGGDGYDATATSNKLLADLWKYETSSGNWIWMKGSSTANQAGTYLSPGAGSPAELPGSRYGSATWTDGVGNLWLGFGHGAGTSTVNIGKLNDMWFYNAGSNQWTWVYGGGGIDFPAIYGTLNVFSGTSNPGSRRYTGGWTDANNNLWLFGGFGQVTAGAPSKLGDLWKFTNCYISPITLSITTSNTFICAKETVTISVSGASAGNYTWSTGSTVSSIFVSIPSTSVFVASTSNTNGCIYSGTFTQNINPCTSINELNQPNEVTLYPNPNKGLFTIKSPNDGQLYLYTATGKLLYETNLTANEDLKIEMNLSSGIYFYSIKSLENKVLKGKVIVE